MMAYHMVEPFGEERADLRNAILCNLVSNALGGKSKIENYMIDNLIEISSTPKDLTGLEKIMAARYGNNR